jgi:SAM-dependent methyltransferase
MANLGFYFKTFGFSPRTFVNSVKGIYPFLKNYSRIKYQSKSAKDFPISSLKPCLFDRYEEAGSLSQHYFYQDLYVARQIYNNKPEKHVDIGSRIDGFVAHIASFREVEVFDIRDIKDQIPGVKFVQADLMDENFPYAGYTDSVSSLHALEHFGLGRYGDNVDINGYLKGLNNIYKLLKNGGRFYFSVPIGKQRIEFDAHRVFSLSYLFNLFKEKYDLLSFSYIDDDNKLFTEVVPDDEAVKNNFNCSYGCGIFILKKK